MIIPTPRSGPWALPGQMRIVWHQRTVLQYGTHSKTAGEIMPYLLELYCSCKSNWILKAARDYAPL